jgi:hypothetical protein
MTRGPIPAGLELGRSLFTRVVLTITRLALPVPLRAHAADPTIDLSPLDTRAALRVQSIADHLLGNPTNAYEVRLNTEVDISPSRGATS